MTDSAKVHAKRLAEQLAAHGHAEHAAAIDRALASGMGRTALTGLRDVCQTLLTWVEAFDPVTIGMAEELRVAIDRELEGKADGADPPAP